ncbi:beta-ketoacyl synthase N-terminal-like domain-containing protein [Haloglycomyces albus]|uniref:beta-ketoacyl synthase N-terminal-like domain-containing protein n=1 Tax=Haloglycomyces albus TaxID=526067 RepID=UPI00046CEE85|nr:beta-ketoacyl synthase N-terminal-like domain-containing protein [Haloglycomyces albus]
MSWSIDGVGAVAGVGSSITEIGESLCAGRSAVAPLRGFDSELYGMKAAYEIDDRSDGVDQPQRATRWLLEAIEQACEDADLSDLSEVPIVVGTGLRELRTLELAWSRGEAMEPDDLDFARAIRRRFGAAEVHTVSNACSASLYTLALADDLLSCGEADTVVVAGVDAITESMFGLLDRVQPEPPEQVRPFDQERRGVIMGDGAVAIVLRKGTSSRWGSVRSVAVNCDAVHVTAPDEEGICRAIDDAHRRAGVTTSNVELMFLHGTGTVLNDDTEARAVEAVFDHEVERIPMTAIKSMTGHTSGGSGLLSLAVALWCMRVGSIPPIAGLDEPMSSAKRFRLVSGESLRLRPRLAQVNAFGFGGVNAVAIVEGGHDAVE